MAEVKAKASLDSTGFHAGLARMKGGVKRFGAGLAKFKSVTVAIIAALAGVAIGLKKVIDFGSELTDMAFAAGLTVEAFQKLNAAVTAAGADSNKLRTTLARLTDAQGEVIKGDKLIIEAFEDLGIGIEEVVRATPDELFVRIGKAMKESGNSAERFSALVDLIGTRNAPQMLEALHLLSDGVDQFRDGTKIMSAETARRLDMMADTWKRWKNNVKVALGEALIATGDFLNGVTKEQKEADAAITKMQEEEKERIKERARVLETRKRLQKKLTEAEEREADRRAKIADKELMKFKVTQLEQAGALLGGAPPKALVELQRRFGEFRPKPIDRKAIKAKEEISGLQNQIQKLDANLIRKMGKLVTVNEQSLNAQKAMLAELKAGGLG